VGVCMGRMASLLSRRPGRLHSISLGGTAGWDRPAVRGRGVCMHGGGGSGNPTLPVLAGIAWEGAGYLSGRELGPLTATGAFHSHWGVLSVGTHTYNHCEARMHTIYRVHRHR
jgi:hypothetical protein